MRYTDKVEEKGFISKEKILKYVSEEDIFKLVFGYKPVEYEYVTSPFREDTRPGCWFSRDYDTGKLRFVDFGNSEIINGVNMINIDCFDAVMIYYDLPNFYKALEFIYDKLIVNKNLSEINKPKKIKRVTKGNVIIEADTRPFNKIDARFWSSYGISSDNLIEDKVFAIKRFYLYNTRRGDIVKRVGNLSYIFTDFDNGKKKIYMPLKKQKRFITNLTANDIGGIKQIPNHGKLLVISKSYKDYRVLKNHNVTNIWFQNEGMIPSNKILINLAMRFDNIIIFFDNDEPGIKASKKLVAKINTMFPEKAKTLHLPIEWFNQYRVKDPSDVYKKMGKKNLIKFIDDNKIYTQ